MISAMSYTEGSGEGEGWTEESGESYGPGYETAEPAVATSGEGYGSGYDTAQPAAETYGGESYGQGYETAEGVPPVAPLGPTETDGEGYNTGYAATAYPGARWDLAPAIDGLAEKAWDSVTETAEEAWNWATGDDEQSGGGGEGGAPADGGGGAEGAPPYYDPGDGGLPPGGVPDEALCGEGACPVCSQDRQMSSGCVLEYGHSGEHQCGYGDLYSQGVADIPPPPPLPKCRTVCSVCGQTCMLTLGHDGA